MIWNAFTGIDDSRSGSGLVNEDGDMDQAGKEPERCEDGILRKHIMI